MSIALALASLVCMLAGPRPSYGEEEMNAPTKQAIRRYVAARPGRLHAYDALIIPGFTPLHARQAMSLSQIPAARRRLDLAIQDFRGGRAPFLIVTGGSVHPSGTPYNEALMMREYLLEKGVPADRILVEPYARHSTTNLRNAGRLMLDMRLSSALIVTGFDRPVFDQAFYFGHPRLSTFAWRSRRELGYQLGSLTGIDSHHIAFIPGSRVNTRKCMDPLDV